MEEETTARSTHRSPRPDEEPNTIMNALIGAVVTVLTAPLLPLAAIFGGGVAGYLQQGEMAEGAKVGGISGAIAAVPAVLFAWVVAGLLFFGADPFFALGGLFAAFGFVLMVGYLVGAGALGGALGAYLRREL